MADKPRYISESEIKEIFSLKESDVTKELLVKYFAFTEEGRRFSPQDRFKLPANKLYNKTEIETTVGRYITNLFLLAPFNGKIEYINEPFTSGRVDDLEDHLSQLLLDKIIPIEQMIDYLNRIQWFGYVSTDFIVPGLSLEMIIPNKVVMKRKEELIKKNKKELEAGNPIVATQMEEELLKLAKEQLKDDPSMDLYTSGSGHKFGTHYKNFSIMKGAMKDNATGKYHVSTSMYTDGVTKDDYHLFGDAIVFAAYSRAVGTQKGGYITKQMFAAFQSVVLGPKGSDCHCKKTLDIILTKDNYKLFTYRYIVEGGKLVQLTNDNIKSYIGKLVHLRSPLYCQSDQLCNICSGDLYYNLGIENIGLTVTKVGLNVGSIKTPLIAGTP